MPEVDDYRVPPGCCDELLDTGGEPREHAASLLATLQRLGPDALVAAGERREEIFMQQGITFEVTASDGARRDRPFPLDLVPRVMPAGEWTTIKRGLAQRIRALNAFVDDVYHAHEIVRAGIVPWSLIVSRPSFARPVHGVRAPGGVYCHVSGCDLVRDGDGSWRVLEDNVRTPSGISYVIENRVAMTRLMPELFAGHRVRPIDHYPSLLLDALRAVAPAGGEDPNVVVWTPGPLNPAYFEHTFLARQMGVELVEATDLVVRDAICFMRTTAGLQRVHAIYRRLDDDFIDPLEFRPDSLLGVPGLVRAYREGTVAIANAIGTGVADDKAIYNYVPEMIRFYLGEEPILDNVPTYLLTNERTRREVLERLDELVVKPTSESGGKGVFIGPHASAAEREHQAQLIEADPARFIAQDLVHLSTAPTEVGEGKLAPRHVDLRPFAVFGDEIRIVPGGLTRVALREGSLIVNSSQGGGSKDTWVLAEDGADERHLEPTARAGHRACPMCATAAGPTKRNSNNSSNARQDRPRTLLARAGSHACRAHGADARRRLSRRRHRSAGGPRRHAQLGGRRRHHRRQATRPGRGAQGAHGRAAAVRPPRGGRPPDGRYRHPRLHRFLHRPGPRACAHASRCDLDRDVGGAQLVLPLARPLRPTGGLDHGALLGLSGGQGALRAVLGARRAHDAPRREPLLSGGGRPDRGSRHGAPHAAGRGAGRSVRGRRRAEPGHEGEAIALLHAVGGVQAYQRAVRYAPALPAVVRFLLYDDGYPASVAFSLQALRAALHTADAQPRSSPPVLRLGRLIADLELQRRTPEGFDQTLERVQRELELVDHDIDERYFAIAALAAVHL